MNPLTLDLQSMQEIICWKTVYRFRLNYNYNKGNRKFLKVEEIERKSLPEFFLNNDHHIFEEDFSICSNANKNLRDRYQRVLLD